MREMNEMTHCANPILVEVTRGSLVESRHRGAIAVVNAEGQLVASWGDIDMITFPRSSLKPFQAMALVETGALDAFALGTEELALACASHNGEPGHVERVAAWLEKLGLGADDLECGSHLPIYLFLNPKLPPQALTLTNLHNNCSGKHAGFLTTALHLGAEIKGYVSPSHPVQRRVAKVVADLAGLSVDEMAVSIDGCSAPSFGLPLRSFAYALARLGNPTALAPERAKAARRIVEAMRMHPWLVAGTDRSNTTLMEDPDFPGIAKSGAEGFFAIALPEHRLGIAIKIDDGAGRASTVAAIAVLEHLGLLSTEALQRLDDLIHVSLKNDAGFEIGAIRPAQDWSEHRS